VDDVPEMLSAMGDLTAVEAATLQPCAVLAGVLFRSVCGRLRAYQDRFCGLEIFCG